MANGPLALLGAGAIAPVGPPLPVGDVHLEIVGAAFRAVEAVIAAGMVPATIGFELIDEIEDVEAHHRPPCARICARPAEWTALIPVLPMI